MLLGCDVHGCLAIRLLTNLADFHSGNISLSIRDIQWSLWDHWRACDQCVYFCEHETVSTLENCEQRAL